MTSLRSVATNLITTSALCVPLCASAQEPAAHATARFSFTIAAPLAQAASLFGPEGERGWSGGTWDPHFVFPVPARDVEGAVFTIEHGEHRALWVNTRFNPAGGRMQYVYFLPGLFTCTIDVALHSRDSTHTQVEVAYTRTALSPGANEHVRALSDHDSKLGPEWEQAIASYLAKSRNPH